MQFKTVIHDLLNSLTVINGNLSLALKSKDLEAAIKRVEKAALANQKAIEICNSALGREQKELIDIKEFYQISSKILKDLYPKIDIKFEVHFAGKVLVDKIYFFRVNENVIKNSVEAGANKLAIIFTEHQISFIDNGTGIKPGVEQTIAKHGTSKESGHGIGLGSIASFCTEHGFRLKVGNNDKNDIFSNGFHIHILFNN